MQRFAPLLVVLALATQAQAEIIDYKRLYQRSAPAVVVVFGSAGATGSRGTGSIIDASGLVLTNTHVVTRKGTDWPQLFVFLKPPQVTGSSSSDLSRRYAARLVAKHPRFDLALLQIVKPPQDLRALPLSDLRGVAVGEPTVAIGHPGGGALWSLTTGRLSASFENYRGVQGWHVFQTETPLNPGNSGGPLLDGSGAIIGVNTFIVRKGAGNLALVGLNFAVKASTVRRWIGRTIGRLPQASELRLARTTRPPAVEEVQKAAPPAKPDPTATARAVSNRPWSLRSKSKRRRRWQAVQVHRRPKSGYQSKIRAGVELGGRRFSLGTPSSLRDTPQLETTNQDAFDEMDRELGRRRNRERQ